jgi:hypothetical protein
MYLRVPGREGRGGARINIHPGGGWLQYHERWGGHTLARHVGHTDAQLLTRLQQSARIRGASTFFDQETAESLMSQTIKQNRALIQQWLRSGSDDALVLQYTGRSVIGRGLIRGEQAVHPMTDARVLLRRALHRKYYVHTAYPE